MRQIIIGILGILAGAGVFADGLYLGGQFGGDMTLVHRDSDVKHTVMTGGITQGATGGYRIESTHKFNFTGGAYAGYSIDIGENKSLALEFDYFVTSNQFKYEGRSHDLTIFHPTLPPTEIEDITTKFKDTKGDTYGLSVLGGYGLNEKVKVYGRLGLAQTSLKYERWGEKAKTWKPLGMMLGMGVELNLSEHCEKFRIRADYRYIHYPTKKLASSSDFVMGKSDYRDSYTLRSHMVMVGIHYQF